MDFLLLEDDGKILLENNDGAVLIESVEDATFWTGGVGLERGAVSPGSYQVGTALRW